MIVLDEAPSALGSSGEEAVMEEPLSRDLGMVMIAQCIITVQRCDHVVRLDHGTVLASGPPSLILASN
jgi:ABC-type multidrug transport system fused ATPase/permease subunit